MTTPPRIFDRRLYALRRARARGTTFLVQEVAAHIAERIGSFGRRFERALDLSSRPESFTELRISADHWIRTALAPPAVGDVGEGVAVADEEALPFAPDSFDLVTSVLSLHAVNDLPGSLIQLRRALRPGGLFMGAMFGGETLKELRAAFSAGESQITAGASLRVAPLADLRDLGALLQRAGFVRPVTDTERTVVRYCDFTSLVADLRALGETNALAQRSRKVLRRDVLDAALGGYAAAHAEPDGRIRATFDIIYLTGMAP